MHSEKMSNSAEPEWLVKAAEWKRAALERLAAMADAERDVVSSPGSWSASGIVEHLILVEECVAVPWRERLLTVPNAKAGAKSRMLSRMGSFIMSQTGLRVPTVDELEPVGGIGVDELGLRWMSARKRLIEALPDDSDAAWVLHPVFGPLSSAQMGGLMSAHLEHHLRHWPKAIK